MNRVPALCLLAALAVGPGAALAGAPAATSPPGAISNGRPNRPRPRSCWPSCSPASRASSSEPPTSSWPRSSWPPIRASPSASTTSPRSCPIPVEAEKQYEKSRELAKNASEGERRFIEAMSLRAPQPGRRLREVHPAPGGAGRRTIRASGSSTSSSASSRTATAAATARWSPSRRRSALGTSPRVNAFIAERRSAEGPLRQGPREPGGGREEPAQGLGAVRGPLRRSPSATSTRAIPTPPSSRWRPTSPNTRPTGSTSSSPRCSSGTPWRASTWRRDASTRR